MKLIRDLLTAEAPTLDVTFIDVRPLTATSCAVAIQDGEEKLQDAITGSDSDISLINEVPAGKKVGGTLSLNEKSEDGQQDLLVSNVHEITA